jgi:dTDP-4-amino-4,6-dideoxygalactose transaminase
MIPFNDLRPLIARYRQAYEEGLRRVLDRGWFILGPEVEAFEAEFAAYHGAGYHAIAVGHGTDAIELALRAAGVGHGDEVITTPLTAVPTVCAIERAGARPVFADIDPHTCTLDPAAVQAAIRPSTRAMVPVHLYGRPADLAGLLAVARAAGLLVLEDCAQAHGARIDGQPVGTFGDLAAFSFYPTKNLGAFGDGGAVLTSDGALAERIRRLRNYGQADRYQHVERGQNSRLDEVQAALLRVTLAHLDEHNEERRRLAAHYRRFLKGVGLPAVGPALGHVYHLFVVRHPDRDGLRCRLAARGVGTGCHYPLPVHLQPAYADLGYGPGSFPMAERVAREVLSLPLYLGMSAADLDAVCGALVDCLQEAA